MSSPRQTFRRLTGRVQRRFRTARPGSVLIMVVALLVLMALIGTAWITTARTDRYGAQQHSYNTQVDLLIDAVINLATSQVVADLFGQDGYRSARGNLPTDYETYDSPDVRDPFLASRLPQGAGATPYWPYVSGSPDAGGFEAPYATNAANVRFAVLPAKTVTVGGSPQPIPRVLGIPTFVDVPGPNGTTRMPALQFDGLTGDKVLAADSDGDGIADACLFRLPVGNLNGITYYGAYRIIDNNSAVNVNTAWASEPNVAVNPANSLPIGANFFPSNINLAAILNPQDPAMPPAQQVIGLNRVRFNGSPADDANPAALTPPAVPVSGPVDVAGVPTLLGRADFTFYTPQEAFWRMSGSRLANPGYVTAAGGITTANRYHPLDITEQFRLAYKYILRTPSSGRSILEQDARLSRSIYDNAPTKAYASDDVVTWFNANFDFVRPAAPGATPQMPARALLVASNPTSNAAVSHPVSATGDKDWVGTNAYRFGDRAYHGGRTYVAMVDIAAGVAAGPFIEPGMPGMDLYWSPMSWRNSPTKASVNTASFAELWMAYVGVMDNRAPGATAPAAPYPIASATPVLNSPPRPRRQFRNPLRNPLRADHSGTPVGVNLFVPPAPDNQGLDRVAQASETQLLPDDVMKLRAALAAVNTIDARDSDRDISARRIILQAYVQDTISAPPPAAPTATLQNVDVNVYGYEPQPFITEVYYNNDVRPSGARGLPNPKGYIAIELYNPYPFPISLAGWQLAVADRRPIDPTAAVGVQPVDTRYAPNSAYYSRYPYMVMQPLTGFLNFSALSYTAPADNPLGLPNVPVVPAGGYLILENYATGPGNGPPEGSDETRWSSAYLNYPATLGGNAADAGTMVARLADAATYRPPSSGIIVALPATSRYFVPGLHDVVRDPASPTLRGGEIYLLRPRRADGVLSSDLRPDSAYQYSELPSNWMAPEYARCAGLSEMIPVDSVDLSQLEQVGLASPGPYQNWRYVRHSVPGAGPLQFACAYPGRWDVTTPWILGAPPASLIEGRQEGVVTTGAYPIDDPWSLAAPVPPITLGAGNAAPTYEYPFLPGQLAGQEMPGWNKLLDPATLAVNPQPYTFPFGAFARNGDILQVMFAGAYRIRPTAGYPAITAAMFNPAVFPPPLTAAQVTDMAPLNPFIEMNAITTDLTYVHDADSRYAGGLHTADADNDIRNTVATALMVSDDADEQVGRFAPLDRSPRIDDPTQTPPPAPVNDYFADATPTGETNRYRWSMDLFDFLTVHSPQDNYLPDMDPAALDPGLEVPVRATYVRKYPAPTSQPFGPGPTGEPGAPEPISNRVGGNYTTANAGNDDSAGTDGLININTASPMVLSAVPFVAPGSDALAFTAGVMAAGTNGIDDNYDIAQAIVYFRDIDANPAAGNQPHGPFKSLFELNMIYDLAAVTTDPLSAPGLRNLWGTWNMPAGPDPDDADGDFSPINPAGGPEVDGVRLDFEERFLMINRLSNLLTTRSDTFTIYVQVQGWRGLGTPQPELVVQRRGALIVDRNNINGNNRVPTTVNIPTD
jgi:hypothetical protein